MDMDI